MKDLTKGYPAKVIMMFAIPLMFGSIFQQFYNMADSMIVSAYVGTDALAAIGATGVVSNTIIGFVNGLTQGFSILVATSFGARDMKRMRRFVAGTTILTFSIAIVLTIIGLIFIEPILELLNTPEKIMSVAVTYVRIIIAGTIFTALYNMCANVLRAVGDSKTPLYCLVVAVVVNIGLDLLFVREFNWGIEGAAYATVIAQALSGILCGGYLIIRFKEILPRKDEWSISEGQYGSLFTTGLSMGLMGCIVNLGTIVLQGSINGLGTDIVAAHTAARRVFDILMVAVYTEGVAMTTFASQNIGAGFTQRVKQGVRHSLLIVTGITTLLIIICYLFGEPVLKWITKTDNQIIIDSAVMYVKVGIWFFYVLGPLFIFRCTLQGIGRKIVPIVSSGLEMAVKILSASFLVPVLGYLGVALTEPISWIVMTLLLAVAYYSKPL